MKGTRTELACLTSAMDAWRFGATIDRRCGLRQRPLPAMTEQEAERVRREASDLYWTGRITSDQYYAELIAVNQAMRANDNPVMRSVSFLRSKVSKSAKRRILARDGDACWLCGDTMPEDDRTIEHVEALSRGGSNDLANLVLTHAACNVALGSLPVAGKMAMRKAVQS